MSPRSSRTRSTNTRPTNVLRFYDRCGGHVEHHRGDPATSRQSAAQALDSVHGQANAEAQDAAGTHERSHAASGRRAEVGDSHQAEESEAQAAVAMTLW